MSKNTIASFTDETGNKPVTVSHTFDRNKGITIKMLFPDEAVKAEQSPAFKKAQFYFKCLENVEKVADVIHTEGPSFLKLLILVAEMRAMQQAYFKSRKKETLLQAKGLETQVDNLLAELRAQYPDIEPAQTRILNKFS